MNRRVWLGLGGFALGLVLLAFVSGQIPHTIFGANVKAPPSKEVKLGLTCLREKDGKVGVLKRDGCDRTYCGLVQIKETIELQPNFAAEHACTWQLVEAQCNCLKASKP